MIRPLFSRAELEILRYMQPVEEHHRMMDLVRKFEGPAPLTRVQRDVERVNSFFDISERRA